MSLYCFATLGGEELGFIRLRGVGLANCLFPWARCVLASERFGLKRIASTWPQICHRQWMRRDLDKRCYIGLMDDRRGAISGVKKIALLATRWRITENKFLSAPQAFHQGIVLFEGIDGYFASMLADHAFLRKRLIDATRPKYRPPGPLDAICIHVRYGDATPPDSPRAKTLSTHFHLRQRMSWFVHALSECRRHLGQDAPALVFSDATDGELRPLLALPGVRRVFFGSAISDLLAMSSARVLIASGSTFSMWAAYLGRMPVIWPPSQRRQRLHGPNWEYETELGQDRLPEPVASLISAHRAGAVARP